MKIASPRQRYKRSLRKAALEYLPELYAAQEGRCHWCGRRTILKNVLRDAGLTYVVDGGNWIIWLYENQVYQGWLATIDHLVPLARGGRSDPDNLVVSCRPCNHGRADALPPGHEPPTNPPCPRCQRPWPGGRFCPWCGAHSLKFS